MHMEKKRDMSLYKSIINMPYEKSTERAHMKREDRAAQFSPFSALTGYDEIVRESARRVSDMVILSENEKEKINERLVILLDNTYKRPSANITYFVPDEKKEGGKYVTESIRVKRIDSFDRVIVSEDGLKIGIDMIRSVESELFDGLLEL